MPSDRFPRAKLTGASRPARKATRAIVLAGLLALALLVVASYRWGSQEHDLAATATEPDDVSLLARSALAGLQSPSFRNAREYCGLVLADASGRLSLSKLVHGVTDECVYPEDIPPGKEAIATFHTHGASDPDYDNEVPSLLDIESTIADGIDGYVSTPGGRVWIVDWEQERVQLLCGERCVTQDPDYVPDPDDRIRRTYTLRQLEDRAKAMTGEP